jgi:hypothetical protein
MVLAYIAVTLGMTGCGCSPTLVSEKGSPDGRYFATVFTYDCGPLVPMMPSNQYVSIRRNGDPLPPILSSEFAKSISKQCPLGAAPMSCM